MNILSANDKTIFSLNLPRTTCDTTCPFFKKICYAGKGRFVFKSVIEANNKRLALFENDPDKYFNELKWELIGIMNAGIFHVRIFGIGDFPNVNFAERLVNLANELPDMNFWIASYKAQFMKLPIFPKNVTIRLSIQNTNKRNKFLNQGHSVSNVLETVESITEGAVICKVGTKQAENCKQCGNICWNNAVKHIVYIKH